MVHVPEALDFVPPFLSDGVVATLEDGEVGVEDALGDDEAGRKADVSDDQNQADCLEEDIGGQMMSRTVGMIMSNGGEKNQSNNRSSQRGNACRGNAEGTLPECRERI